MKAFISLLLRAKVTLIPQQPLEWMSNKPSSYATAVIAARSRLRHSAGASPGAELLRGSRRGHARRLGASLFASREMRYCSASTSLRRSPSSACWPTSRTSLKLCREGKEEVERAVLCRLYFLEEPASKTFGPGLLASKLFVPPQQTGP